jgi:hypothetical protein
MRPASCQLDHAGLLNEEKNKKKCYWVKDRQQKRPVFSRMSLIIELFIPSEDDLKNYIRTNDDCFNILFNSAW